MYSKLEELLGAWNIENEKELKNALDKIISEHKLDEDTALLDEAIELRLSLEGISDSALQEHLKIIRRPLPKKKGTEGGLWFSAVKRILPMAAAFAVIVSVMLLVPRISDDYPIVPSTHPLSSGNASSITSSAPATTIAPPTSTVPPVSTEGVVPPATGGMNWNKEYYDENFQESFFLEGYLPFSEYKQAFEEWKKEFVMFGKTGGRENFEYNTYTMITELGLPREQVEEWSYHYFAKIYDPKVYENTGILTEEELDRIYSGDKAGYYQLKVSPFAFVVGEYVINMRWLDEHSVEDYREVGITYEKLIEYGVEGMFGKYCPEKLDGVMAKVDKLKKA